MEQKSTNLLTLLSIIIICLRLISLGKFGTFQASEIISKPFDLSYEIYGRNKVRQAQTFNYLDHFGNVFKNLITFFYINIINVEYNI